jgi:4-amino-4-deoxy-L-arabinose transferase-like glycosyltransferase
VYHLTGPRLFIEAGRVTHSIDLPYLGFPQLGEMQFTLGMLLAGDGTAGLLHFGYGMLGAIVTAALAGRAFGKDAGWLAAALLLSVPSLLSLMSQAYVDATLLFYATAAFYAFVRWRELHNQGAAGDSLKWLRVMGVLCGLSAGVKYTAVAVPVALGMSLLWTMRRAGLRVIAGRLAQWAAITVLVALPWLAENWLTTGNPIYPFVFSGVYWDAWRAWWYDRPGTGLAATAPWRLLVAPLEATVLGVEGGEPYDATLGPLLLISSPLLAAAWRGLQREERSIAGHLLVFFGLNYGLWLWGLARSALLVQPRLLLPVFGIVAVLGAVGVDRLAALRRPQLALDWLARAVISLTLALLLFSTLATFLRANPLPVALGLESHDDYLARLLGVYHPAMAGVNALPPGARVVFLWEPRGYPCRVDCRPDALLDHFLHLTYLYSDAGAIARAWRAEGVTHVLLYRRGMEMIVEAGFDPVTPRDLAIMNDLQAHYLSPVSEWGDAYVLYELVP